ncbi:hypothetical protein GGI25_001420 [Coemansia spiralis]|uniref:SET domain-containing protein n=2 Tax=Coemansia TaxID=4863 RepID=A0A9W8GC57_9FUNG|nr:hypothetical protein EDC05_001385 [Coemansia umbellata]KAJ2624535.1 hypothetical protein GGI26_001454 [Coemansia sp. RSA 1358]KAJ2679497.1 hypothetical protein GGI25_001420 [Coemansia spiralis]
MPESNSTSFAEQAAETPFQTRDDTSETRRSLRKHQPRYLDNSLTGNEVFDLLDEFIVEETGHGGCRRRKTKSKPRQSSKRRKTQAYADVTASETPAGLNIIDTTSDSQANNGSLEPRTTSATRPRWYNQMYLMFLALRQSPGFTASRSELVRKAVELDQKISSERGLPKAFTGKTPQNSASALLTNNGDRHFTQFRPPGARCYHFRLAYNPGDFESALASYNKWMSVLVEKDWPVCFATEIPGVGEDGQPVLSYDNVPKSWQDIVEVKPSTIANAGNGLFAVHDLPPGIPLGFYFGVPMTEDEFDSLKEKTGMASHYSIMYRKTVLDATDDNGMPYSDPNGRLYCPFHFMNEAREGQHDQQKCNIVFLEGIEVNQIICLTARKIVKGEELFVSYGDEVDRSHWDSSKGIDKADIVTFDDCNVQADGGQKKEHSFQRSGSIRAVASPTKVADNNSVANGENIADSVDGNTASAARPNITSLLQKLQTAAPNTADIDGNKTSSDFTADAACVSSGNLCCEESTQIN